ncbi:MAG: hypothetical protein GY780_10480 [bacterium]|nr:hypothetical protein [bacterium]
MNLLLPKNTIRLQGRNFIIFWGLLFVLIGIMNAPDSQAQTPQYDLIAEYIERNTELLEWSYEVVRETENVPARQVLKEAQNLHLRSIRLLDENHPLMASNTAKSARTAMRNAVRLARESMGYEERLLLRVERFRDQHSHLLEQAREAHHKPALEFLRRSETMALRAQEQYQQGDARLAFKMLKQAEELMHRAARQLANDGGGEKLDRKIEMARTSLERAQEKLQNSDDPAALKMLTKSDEALDQALVFRDQGQPGRALQMANLCQRLARQAMNGASTAPNSEAVERQIERWDERHNLVTEKVLNSKLEAARRLLERARQQRFDSERSLGENEIETALRRIRAAHDLLTQAEDLIR